MTYNEKLAYLRSYRQQEHHIDALLAEAERWRSRAKAMTAHYGATGTKGGSTGFPWAVEKVLELEGQMGREIDAIQETRKKVVRAIDGLKDARQASVLRLKYISGKREQEIADKMHYHIRYIQKLHRQGVKNLSL